MGTTDSKRVALVTGGNRGIGLEVCRQLAARGLQVILTARDTANAESAARDLHSKGLDVTAETLDVVDERGIRALARRVDVDVLINNAAILIREEATILGTAID